MRLFGSWIDRLEVALPTAGYLVAAGFGITTSSLAQPALLERPAHPLAPMLGAPLDIRSDEWFTQAPIELNVLAAGHSTHSPLAQAPDLIYQVSSGGFFESLLFAEGNLLRLGPWLPDAMLFSAFRLFPWLLVLLCLPPLLRRFGANRAISWLAVALCFFAPASAWWSFMPIRILGFAAAGCYLLVLGFDRWQRGSRANLLAGLALAGVGGVCLARLATFYVPWGVSIGLPLIAATGAFVIADRATRRAGLIVFGVGAAMGTLMLAGTLWENIDSLRAEFGTLYPGQRRVTGAAMPLYHLFGAPGNFQFNDGPPGTGAKVEVANSSELSSAWLICAVWAAMVWSRLREAAAPGLRWARWSLVAVLTLWSAWIVAPWGWLGEHLPVLNMLPPARIAQTIGFPAVLLLAIVLPQIERPKTWRATLPIVVVCGLVTLAGVGSLQVAVPSLEAYEVWLSAIVVAALIWWLSRSPSWLPVTVTALITGFFAMTVNPILVGLGDLRTSTSAAQLRTLADKARNDGTFVVTDDWGLGGAMVAINVPTLVGFQVTGPVRDEWAKIDPTGQYEFEWNRGASYLRFDFAAPAGSEPVVTNPTPDTILVSVDPCWLPDSGLDVGYVISPTPDLAPQCLKPRSQLRWSGTPRYVYDVVD